MFSQTSTARGSGSLCFIRSTGFWLLFGLAGMFSSSVGIAQPIVFDTYSYDARLAIFVSIGYTSNYLIEADLGIGPDAGTNMSMTAGTSTASVGSQFGPLFTAGQSIIRGSTLSAKETRSARWTFHITNELISAKFDRYMMYAPSSGTMGVSSGWKLTDLTTSAVLESMQYASSNGYAVSNLGQWTDGRSWRLDTAHEYELELSGSTQGGIRL